MAETTNNNLIYKVIAILLAILLWLYVTADQNPPLEKTLNLNINYENLREDLTLISKSDSVNVKIRGDSKLINSLGLKDFGASVDLSQVKMGEQTLPVKINNALGVEIVDISPKEVLVNVDKIAERQIPVQVALLGQTAHGYSSFKATIKPSQVVIRGPQNILDTLEEARADVNLNSAQSNLVLNLPIKVQDKWGNWYGADTLNIIPNTVEVFIPVVQDTPSKTVPVKPVLEGKPAPGYQIARILVEPETVKILGQFNKLDTIDRVQTLPIMLSDVKENVVREVNLSIPSGVTLLYGTKVKVIIQVEESPVHKTFELPLKTHNSKSSQKVALGLELVKVKIEGKKEVINKLTANDLKAYVDVAGVDFGTHDLEVQIDAPGDVQILAIEPQKVKVEIKPVEDKPATSSSGEENKDEARGLRLRI
ncbi:MAG: YbbR-like domain-containing protein [Peptococcales bacterium]|jgi:YbbR domain-containing protein